MMAVGIAAEGFDAVVACVRGLGFDLIDPGQSLHEFVRNTHLLPCRDPESGMAVEIQFSYFEIQRAAVRRAATVVIEGYRVRFATVEDLILMKVVAGRAQDIEDVKAIYLRNAKRIDALYLSEILATYQQMLDESFVERFEQIKRELARKIGDG
jgi:hypothetical protein